MDEESYNNEPIKYFCKVFPKAGLWKYQGYRKSNCNNQMDFTIDLRDSGMCWIECEYKWNLIQKSCYFSHYFIFLHCFGILFNPSCFNQTHFPNLTWLSHFTDIWAAQFPFENFTLSFPIWILYTICLIDWKFY
jgi:hypothetical protein